MEGSYNIWLVGLSYVVATAASYTALELARRVAADEGRRWRWLTGGAISMGFGIWTMHFVGMLAYSMAIPFSYDPWLTLLSLVVGIGAAGFAIHTASRSSQTPTLLGLSGLFLGGGIASMHYTGMAAMRMEATLTYRPSLLVLSVLIAILAATAALWIIFTLANRRLQHHRSWKAAAALIMGVAISGMHYTGMAAAVYVPNQSGLPDGVVVDNTWFAVAIGIVALFILGLTHLTILFDTRLGVEREAGQTAANKACHLSEILDGSSDEIYFLDPETTHFVSANQRARTNLGYSEEELANLKAEDIQPRFDPQVLRRMVLPLLQGSRKDLLYNTAYRRKDGSEYEVEVHMRVATFSERQLFVAIVTDVSETRELALKLRRAERMHAVGEMAFGVANEILKPATSAAQTVQSLEEDLATQLEFNKSCLRLFLAVKAGEDTTDIMAELEPRLSSMVTDLTPDDTPGIFQQVNRSMSRVSRLASALMEFGDLRETDRSGAGIDLNHQVTTTAVITAHAWSSIADVQMDLAPDLPKLACSRHELNHALLLLLQKATEAVALAGLGDRGQIRIQTRTRRDHLETVVSVAGASWTGTPEGWSEEEIGGQLGHAEELAERKLGGYLKVDDQAYEEDEEIWSTATLGVPIAPGRGADRPSIPGRHLNAPAAKASGTPTSGESSSR